MDIKNNPEILVKYLSGESSAEEEKIIEAWLISSEEKQENP